MQNISIYRETRITKSKSGGEMRIVVMRGVASPNQTRDDPDRVWYSLEEAKTRMVSWNPKNGSGRKASVPNPLLSVPRSKPYTFLRFPPRWDWRSSAPPLSLSDRKPSNLSPPPSSSPTAPSRAPRPSGFSTRLRPSRSFSPPRPS